MVKLNSEKSKLNAKNEELHQENLILEAKLKDMTKNLQTLEKMQESLESKIPTKESLEAYAEDKTNDLIMELEEVKKDNRLLKVDVRLSERKHKEAEDRIGLYKEMYNDLKKKKDKEVGDEKDLRDKVAELETKLQHEKSTKEEFEGKNQRLLSRLDR